MPNDTAGRMSLGVFDEVNVSDEVVDLHHGDVLVMVTDVVLEASSDDRWVTDEIPELLRGTLGMTSRSIADRIERAVASLEDRRTDDVAVLVIQAER